MLNENDAIVSYNLNQVNYLLNEHDLQGNDFTFLKLLKEVLECGDEIKCYQRDLLNVMFVSMYEYEPISDMLKNSSNMEYLIRNTGEKVKAHLWDDKKQDTKCKMYSSGGMNRDRFSLHKNRKGKDICTMCKNINQGG